MLTFGLPAWEEEESPVESASMTNAAIQEAAEFDGGSNDENPSENITASEYFEEGD